MIQTQNPRTEQNIKAHTLLKKEAIAGRIDEVKKAQLLWASTSFDIRSQLMHKAAVVLEKNKMKYALLISKEMGKIEKEAIAEVEKCAKVCRYYADNAEDFLKDQFIQTEYYKSFITHQPIGIVLAVMPWNYPFWQVFRFAAPILMSGNAAILKHASNVLGSGDAIASVFEEAGFPKAIFAHLKVSSNLIEELIKNPKIAGVTLTGSEVAGSAVAGSAGKYLKKSVLELGGSDAYIILEDADLNLAIDKCVQSRLKNAGQSCIGAKRFIVEEAIYDLFIEKFEAAFAKYEFASNPIGDHYIGPLARKDLRAELHEQVISSVAAGATIRIGGFIPETTGFYYPPTILENVSPDSKAYKEELFGPVAVVFKVQDVEEAISIANDTSFGLGAGIFTADLEKGEAIAKNRLEAGASFVNDYVQSHLHLPFGGIKNSGFGRELSHLGILEFVNQKTVVINK